LIKVNPLFFIRPRNAVLI